MLLLSALAESVGLKPVVIRTSEEAGVCSTVIKEASEELLQSERERVIFR